MTPRRGYGKGEQFGNCTCSFDRSSRSREPNAAFIVLESKLEMWVSTKNSEIEERALESALREICEHNPTTYQELLKNLIDLYKRGHLEKDELDTIVTYLFSLQIEKDVTRKINDAFHQKVCPYYEDLYVKI